MDIQYLTDRYAVSPQLNPAQIETVRRLGFTTLICNRPDGEVDGQPTIEQMGQAAEAYGVAFHVIPMSGPACSPEQVSQLELILGEATGKVLGYCRTGRRSSVIWHALQASKPEQGQEQETE